MLIDESGALIQPREKPCIYASSCRKTLKNRLSILRAEFARRAS
jgi:hypothetical protein